MKIDLRDRIAIVTGAGGGLGAAYCRLLASLEAAVVANDRGVDVSGAPAASDAAQSVVREIRTGGGKAIADSSDVATPEGGEELIRVALRAFGRIDAVVHSAGILRDRTLAKMSLEELRTVLDVHLLGGFYVAGPAFRTMKEQGHGRFVFTTSSAGLFGNFGQANYAAAKMGLVGLAKTLAVEGQKYDIKANCIAPIARTRMTESLSGPFAEVAQAFPPEAVSPVVAYLCSPACAVTGEVYSVGGSHVSRVFVGRTRGITHPDRWTVDEVAARIDELNRTDVFTVPRSSADELQSFIEAVVGRSTSDR